MSQFDVIAFDADDTLWQSERVYVSAQAELRTLLERYGVEGIDEQLHATEMRNLRHFGYGIKGFALSMIEAAVGATDGRIGGRDVLAIIDLAKRMLSADVELLDQVEETLALLAASYELMLITKGDLHDQEAKISRSGLAERFGRIEIVSDKSRESYGALLRRHGIAPGRFVMVGNSLRSDILPVLGIGATAVYVPHELTWSHESAASPAAGTPGYHEIEHIGLLPALLEELEPGVRRGRE